MNDQTGGLTVQSLSDSDGGRWDAFVNAQSDGTFFHRAGWKRVIEETYGHRAHFIYASQNGEIRGVLPLVHVKNLLFGNRLVSTPFCMQGGPVVLDEAARQALNAHAAALATELNVDFIEYRSEKHSNPDWACKDDLYYIFRRDIDPDNDANLKAIPRKQRAVVRKAIKAEELQDEIDDTADRFYEIYATSVRNLGTPVFPKRYCDSLKATFGDDCEYLIIVDGNGRPVSSVLQFYFRDQVLPYYGGGLPEARNSGAYSFMYWRSTCRAAERGMRIFDFGRSKKDTGAFAFKKNWGFEPQPLQYEYWLKDGVPMPDVNPLNPKYHLMVNTWRKLPLPVANLVGPRIFGAIG